MKKICKIIVGSDGLIGSELVKSFKNQIFFTISRKKKKYQNHFNCNLENLNALKKIHSKLKKKYKKFLIFYLAGNSRVRYERKDIRKLSISSIKKILNILNTFQGPNVKIILPSSGSVYASSKKILKEDSKIAPSNFYSSLKYFEENIATEYFRNFKTKVVIARIFSIFSNNKNFFFMDAINKFNLKKKKIIFFGSGKQVRDYSYLNDVCCGLNILAKKGVPGQIYNISTGKYHYLKNILNLINKKMYNNSKIILWDKTNSYYENDFWYGSNRKIIKLGYKYKIVKAADFTRII